MTHSPLRRPLRCELAGLMLLILSGFGTLVMAQDRPATSPAEASRRAFVPVEELDLILQRDQQGVLLPPAEFEKLLKAARENAPAEQAPAPLVMSQADYAARVDGDQLHLTATIRFRQLRPGWQQVVLPFRGVAVESAALNDKPARLGRQPGDPGALVLLSHDVGEHTLTLELAASLVAVGSDKVSALGLPPIAAGTLTLTLPAGQFLQLDDTPLQRPAADDEPAKYAVAVGGRKELSLWITDRRQQQAAETLVFASTAIGVNVAREEQTWRAVSKVQVFGKPIDVLEFVVPKALDITAIESTGLERWEIADGPDTDTTALKLTYRQPFDDARQVVLSGVATTVIGEPWSVPTLLLSNATSHTARVFVQHPASLRLQLVEQTGVRRITSDEAPSDDDMAGMPGTANAAARLYFAAWQEDFVLIFVTQPRERELQATIATRLHIGSRDLHLQSLITVQSRFAPLFELDLTLPAEWNITDVQANGASVPWRVLPLEAGLHQLRIPFNPPIPADTPLSLNVVAHQVPGENWPIEETPLLLQLPEVYLPQSSVTEGTYLITADNDLDLVPGELTGLDPARLPAEQQPDGRAPRLVYEYQDTRFRGQLHIARQPARISARTLAFHRLDPQNLVSHLEARLQIRGGGVRKLAVVLPESAGDDLRFQLVGTALRITDQSAAAPENGLRTWTLQFDQRAYNQVGIVVDLQRPRSTDVKEFVLPSLTLPAAERQDGYIALEAGPDQQLTIQAVDAANAPLNEVDPPDMPQPVNYAPRERIVAAYHSLVPGEKITISETRFDRMPVPTALCDRLDLTSVLGATGEFQHQADFVFRSVGVQSLTLQLPVEARLWATLIDGQPIEVRRAGTKTADTYLVPLPPSGDANMSRRLQLFYRTDVPPLSAAGRVLQTPPRIEVVNGQGTTQPLPILQRNWTVHTPGETTVLDANGEFEPVVEPSRESFLGWLRSSIGVGRRRDLIPKTVLVLLAFIVLAVPALAYRRSGWRGLALAIVCGGGLGMLGICLLSTFRLGSGSGVIARSHSDFSEADAVEAPRGAMEDYLHSSPWAEMQDRMFGEPGQTDFDPEDMPIDGSSVVITGPLPRRVPSAFNASENPPAAEAAAEPTAPQPAPNDLFGSDLAEKAQVRQRERLEQAKNKHKEQLQELLVQRDRELKPAAKIPPASMPAAPPMVANGQPLAGKPGGKGFAAGDQPNLPPLNQRDGQQAAGPQLAGPQAGEAAGAPGQGLLSLSMQMEVPADYRSTQFRYIGVPTAGSDPTLELAYQDRDWITVLVLVVELALVVLFWLIRGWSLARRAALAVLALTVPLALASIAPLPLLPFLDALFLGSLFGIGLWLVLGVVSGLAMVLNRLSRTSAFRSLAGLWLIALLTAGLMSPAPLLFAQEPIPPNSPASDTAVRAGNTAKNPQSRDNHSDRMTTVIVPYTAGEDPLKSERILLPHAQFIELWNRAHPDQQIEAAAPVDGLVAEALYSARVVPGDKQASAHVAVSARYTLYSLRAGQVTVALPLGKVVLTGAKLNDKSAPILTRDTVAPPQPAALPAGANESPQLQPQQQAAARPQPVEPEGELSIVLPERGLHVLDLQFTLPLDQNGPAGRFTLPARPVPAGALRFTFPAADLALKVQGTRAAYRQESKPDENSLAIIPIDQAADVTVSWTPARARGVAEAIVHAEGTTAAVFSDAGLRINTGYQLAVRQGSLADLSFRLPPDVLVRQIASPDLGGWEVAGAGDERTLKVFFRRPITDQTQVTFDLFVPQTFTAEPLTVSLPQFAPQGVTRETGFVGVFVERQLAVTADTTTGLSQIDLNQFTPNVTLPIPESAPQFAYRYAQRPFQLQWQVARQQPQSRATAEHAIFIAPRKIRFGSRFDMTLAGAPRSEVSIQLPPGYLLYDLQANDTVDYFVEHRAGEEAQTILHVELSGPRTGRLELILTGVVPREPTDLAPRLSVPVPLAINELRTSAAIWFDPTYTGSLKAYDGWKSIDPHVLPARLQQARRQSQVQLALSTASIAPQPIDIALQREIAHLEADSLTTIIVEDTAVQYLISLQWSITQAAENRFRFTSPDWLAGRLDFSGSGDLPGPRVRQVLSEKIEGNRLLWTIVLEESLPGRYFTTARATLPPPKTGQIAAPNLRFVHSETPMTEGAGNAAVPPLQPLAIQHHYLMLLNQSAAQLEQLAADAVEPVAADDLPIRISSELSDQAAEIVQVRDPQAMIAWQVQKAETVKSLPASVNLAKFTQVLARDGSWRVQADFSINNRARQFLALQLPEGSQVLSVFVADRPSRPVHFRRKERDLLLIPLPKTAAGDLSAKVRLFYAGRLAEALPKDLQLLRSSVDLPVAQVVSQADDAEFGMPVARTEWTVYFPADLDIQRLRDSDRTNVSESVEGYEQVLATIQEGLSLSNFANSAVVDFRNALAVKRAQFNNKKQLGLAIEQKNNLQFENLSESQQEELQDQLKKLDAANEQLARQQLDGTSSTSGRRGQSYSATEIELQLNQANGVSSFELEEESRPGKDDVFKLDLEQAIAPSTSSPAAPAKGPTSRPGEGKPAQVSSGKATYNPRGYLREQANQQAAQLQQPAQPQDDLQSNLPDSNRRNEVDTRAQTKASSDLIDEMGRAADRDADGLMLQEPGEGGQAWAGLPGWTQSGGLSLALDLPQDGQKLTFSKVGGNAKLAVGVRPRLLWDIALGLVWLAVWLVIGVALAAALRRAASAPRLLRTLAWLAIPLGLAWWYLLPAPALGFALFLAGAVVVTVCLTFERQVVAE